MMTAHDLLKWQIGHVGKQLTAAYEGLSPSGWDHRPSPGAMSPRETAEHLCECYTAFAASATGGKHEWGSFHIVDKSECNLIATMRTMRSHAVATALASNDERMYREATEYILTHDAYHLGQLCASRLDSDPNWNAYAIYEV